MMAAVPAVRPARPVWAPYVQPAPLDDSTKLRYLAEVARLEAIAAAPCATLSSQEKNVSCSDGLAPASGDGILLPPVVWESLHSAGRSSWEHLVAQVAADKQSVVVPQTCTAPVPVLEKMLTPLPPRKK